MNPKNEMQLTIIERVLLSDILPPQGNKLQQIIVRSLLERIKFTKEENVEFEIVSTHNGIKWNAEKADSRTFKFILSEAEISIIKEASSNLDKEGRVNQQNLSLLEKIDNM